MRAAEAVNAVLNLPGADDHVELLAAYAHLALLHGKLEEGVRAVLKAIAKDPQHKRTKVLFGQMVNSSAGLAELFSQLPNHKNAASALAFLGTTAKDEGALSAAEALYRQAGSLVPTSASYVLNLVHILEIVGDKERALEAATCFLKQNPDVSVGRHGCSCAGLLEVLSSPAAAATAAAPASERIRVVDLPGQRDLVVLESLEDGATDAAAGDDRPTETLTDADLDLLALGFTIIKILYLEGRFSVLPEFDGRE